MTKRRNPWSDDSPMQLKSHISAREVANGVDGTTFKEHIHDHTKQLMMNGAKEFYGNPFSKELENIHNNNHHMAVLCEEKPQKSIMEFFCKGPKQKMGKQLKQNLDHFKSNCMHDTPTTQCFFCDQIICPSCEQYCCMCNHSFCSYCSVLSYSYPNEMAVCLSCKR
uniref:Uncharacterized protein n=1 Tax=Ciona savignyi TaxID=51511 RepID=H2YAA8_CIOSA